MPDNGVMHSILKLQKVINKEKSSKNRKNGANSLKLPFEDPQKKTEKAQRKTEFRNLDCMVVTNSPV